MTRIKQRTLFFQGDSRIGKSTVLREVINRISVPVAGFTVQRVLEKEEVIGYQALAVARKPLPPVDVPYRKDMEGVFLLHGKKEISVLERMIAEVERKIAETNCGIIILDEIGGMELTSPLFMEPLRRILSGTKPCIGVLKSKKNLAHTVSELGLQDTYPALLEELMALILVNGSLHAVSAEQIACITPLTTSFLEKNGIYL